MAKSNKKSVTSKTKKQAKKPISKSKNASASKALQRTSTLMFTKKSAHKAPKAPAKPKSVKDWEPGYMKSIQMFKSQPDYFQLNQKYKGL